jgi:hypothetical protein
MNAIDPTSTPRRVSGKAKAAGLLAAGVLAGGIVATAIGASAATTSPTTPSTTSTAAGGTTATDAHRGPGGASPVRGDEKSLSSADAATVKAAALKAVPGGTVYRVETDAGDGEYEAHLTKSDGTRVTVKLDKDFAVTKVEDGMGAGDPAPAGRPGTGG